MNFFCTGHPPAFSCHKTEEHVREAKLSYEGCRWPKILLRVQEGKKNQGVQFGKKIFLGDAGGQTDIQGFHVGKKGFWEVWVGGQDNCLHSKLTCAFLQRWKSWHGHQFWHLHCFSARCLPGIQDFCKVLPLHSQEIANAIKLLPLINSSESHQITFTGFFRSKNGHMVSSKKKLVESKM